MNSVAPTGLPPPTKETTLIPTHQTQELLLKVITILGAGALLCISTRYWDFFSIKSNPPKEPPPQPTGRLPRRASSSVEAPTEDLTTGSHEEPNRSPSYAASPEPSQAATDPHPHPYSLGLGVRDVM